MSNKQYTFSLPPEAAEVIDVLPKTKKSECVANALLSYKKEQARQKALDFIATLKPKKWNTDKDAVRLVQEAREERSRQLLDC
jgi:hypothetical protein